MAFVKNDQVVPPVVVNVGEAHCTRTVVGALQTGGKGKFYLRLQALLQAHEDPKQRQPLPLKQGNVSCHPCAKGKEPMLPRTIRRTATVQNRACSHSAYFDLEI